MTAGISRDFRCIRFLESVDLSTYQAFPNLERLGWGHPRDDERWSEATSLVLCAYMECIDLIADLLKIPITDKRFAYEPAIATEDGEFVGYLIPRGTIAGQKTTWTGYVGDELAIELSVVWRAGERLEPDWPLFNGYRMFVDGTPGIQTEMKEIPPDPNDGAAVAAMGDQVTATPVVNAIPAICAAPPGIRSYADLPLITGHYIEP